MRIFILKILWQVVSSFQPSAVVLQCGADSLAGDRLGTFSLSNRCHFHLSGLNLMPGGMDIVWKQWQHLDSPFLFLVEGAILSKMWQGWANEQSHLQWAPAHL